MSLADIIIFTGDTVSLFLIWILIWAVFGYFLAHAEQRTLGTFLSAFLGPIGLIITLILRLNRTAENSAPPASYIPPIHRQATPPPLPDTFTIRRGFGTQAQHHGPYTLEEVIHYLANGTLLPTDHFLTPAGHWSLLSNTGLI